MKSGKIRQVILETVNQKGVIFHYNDVWEPFKNKRISKLQLQKEIRYLADEELISGEIDESNHVMKRERDNPHVGRGIQVLEITSKGRNWLEDQRNRSRKWFPTAISFLAGAVTSKLIDVLVTNWLTKK